MTSTDAANDGAMARSAPGRRSAVASFAALALTSLLAITALGAYSAAGLQRSAHLALITSVITLLSPLFWPGRAVAARATRWRILGWSLAAALLAVAAMLGTGDPSHVATAGVMLLVICIATTGTAARLETFFVRRGATAAKASDASAWLATALLAIPAAAPLWLGPAAELASAGHPQALEAVVAMSPLTHLAIASGNDLLRNQWFYQHSNLAGLRFDYPRLALVLTAYTALSLVLVLFPAMVRSRPRPGPNSTTSQE